jgi:hypothetical protein
MFACFFKTHKEIDCKCEIVKFIDRLWIDKSSGINCIRTFIIKVCDDSPIPLTTIRMLTSSKDIFDLKSLNYTFLDKGYLFNRHSKGGYAIKNEFMEKNAGVIDYDGFTDVKVFKEPLLQHYPSPEKTAKIIEIKDLDHPINPGEYFAYRISFNALMPTNSLMNDTFFFDLEYLDNKESTKEYNKVDMSNQEIPFLKNLSEEKGGFDVYLYMPEDLIGFEFNSVSVTNESHTFDACENKNKTQKFIWRARLCYKDDSVKYLKVGETPISLRGIIRDVSTVGEMHNKINILRIHSDKSMILSQIALIVSIFGAIPTLYLLLNKSISFLYEWVVSLLIRSV